MSGRKPSWQITALIETHNLSTPYVKCSGCSICKMIEDISKEAGLWIKDQSNQYYAPNGTKITFEQLGSLLDEGYSRKEICQMTGIQKNALARRIKKWFPERYGREAFKPTFDLQEYQRLLAKGMKREDIAKREGINLRKLDYNVGKWYKEAKQHEASNR